MSEPNEADLFDTTAEAAGSSDEEDLILDLSGDDLKARKFSPIPEKTWLQVTIEEAEIRYVQKENRNKGKPMYGIVVQPLPHEADKHGLSPKKRLFLNLMLFPGAFFSTARFLEALGYPVGDPNGGEQKIVAPHPNKLLGLDLDVFIGKHETSNRTDDDGNPYINERVTQFAPLGTKTDQAESENTVSEEAFDLFTTGANDNFS